jgi:hypothetical protein
MKRSFVFIAIAIFFGNTDVFAQEIISISDQDFVQINDCNTAVIISDSNADNGNYGPNEAFSITVCVDESIEESAMVGTQDCLNLNRSVSV